MERLKRIAALSVVFMALCACSTVEGLGKDIKKGGQVIQDAAKNATN